MSGVILFSAAVIFICIIVNKFSNKFGIPSLLFFMLLGIIFGKNGILKFSFNDYTLISNLCSSALLLIIFYGGFCTKKPENKKIILLSSLLSSLGTILTALLTAAFCYLILKMPFGESFLIGAILSSTDAASVFSILRNKKLNLKYDTAPVLEIESGSNDPFAYMLTVLALIILKNESTDGILPMFFIQTAGGIIFGILTAMFGIFIFKKTKLIQESCSSLFILTLAFISYAISDLTGSNGYLSAYIAGIILGNSEIKNKTGIVYFLDGITNLCQIAVFFLLGFLSTPSRFFEVIIQSMGIVLFLTFLARPVAATVLMLPFKCRLNQIAFVSAAGLRGAASIVFAIMAAAQNSLIKYDIFHIVFFVCLISAAFQGSILPYLAKKLDMTDEFSDVLKTFNDYQEESAITLSKIFIDKSHPWLNKHLREIKLNKNSLVLLIQRKGCKVAPKGETVILENDVVLLGATVTRSTSGIKLREMEIDAQHVWKNKKIKDIEFEPGFLTVLIKREGKSFVPNGETKISSGDILVFYVI